MALANMGFKKTKVGPIWGRTTKREGGGEEKRKRKKMEEPRVSQQGMELGFLYGTNHGYEF